VQPSAFDRAVIVSILAVVIEGKPAIILISRHADTRTWKLVTEKPSGRIPGKVVSVGQRYPGPDLRQYSGHQSWPLARLKRC
jgi:hypothetical protein